MEKREVDTTLDPRRAAISRRSRPLDSTRSRIRASDRSSETLFNLLRSDYALESMNVGPIASFSSERRGALSNWNDINALSATMSDPERAALRMTLSDAEPRPGWTGLRRVRSPVPVFRSSASASPETYIPRFPPALPEQEMARERLRERERFRGVEREIERGRVRQAERERQDSDERRRFRPPFAAPVESAASRRGGNGSTGPRFRFPARTPRYLAGVVDENDRGRRSGLYVTRSLHLPRFDIDGLGDRERSLRSTLTNLSLLNELGLIDSIYSPDATQWELVANDLGLQAACDLWESEGSDGEEGEGGESNAFVISNHLWDATQDRDGMRRLTNLFSSSTENGEVDLLAERL